MVGMLGKKLGMTRIFDSEGKVVPATVIEAGPCYVLQVKTLENDGYKAVQLGFDKKKENRVIKPLKGHFKKANVSPLRFIKEIRTDAADQYKAGEVIAADIFQENDFVDVTGTSIGKGFQGGMKRWGWRGGPSSHGSTHHRTVGSVGASSFPSRIFKGHHMPGRMGGDTVTVQKLRVLKVDKDTNTILVEGSIPGHKNSYLILRTSKRALKRKTDGEEQKTQKAAGEKASGKKSPAAK